MSQNLRKNSRIQLIFFSVFKMKLWVMLLSSLQLVKSQFFFISWDLCIVWKFTLCSRLSEYWLMSEVCLNCRVSSLARGISKKNGTEDNLKKKYLRAELRRRKAALSSMANSLTGKNEDTQGVIFLVNFTCWNSFKFFPPLFLFNEEVCTSVMYFLRICQKCWMIHFGGKLVHCALHCAWQVRGSGE